MIKLTFLIVAITILVGCTVSVVDTRITREELQEAFKQRDSAIYAIAEKVKEIESKTGSSTEVNNKQNKDVKK